MNGWRLTGLLSLVLLAMALVFLARHPDVEGLRLVIRATARTSLVLFALAFSAAARSTGSGAPSTNRPARTIPAAMEAARVSRQTASGSTDSRKANQPMPATAVAATKA